MVRRGSRLFNSPPVDGREPVAQVNLFERWPGSGVAGCEHEQVILPVVRDPRLITIRRGGTLTDSNHQLLAIVGNSLKGSALSSLRTRLGAARSVGTLSLIHI